MNDIVERLRLRKIAHHLFDEAADEIERLHNDIDLLRDTLRKSVQRNDELEADIERLRAALQTIIDQGETVCLWDAQQIARRTLEEKCQL